MATRAQPRPLRRGAMHDEGALYDILWNLKEVLNDLTTAGITLEGGAAPTGYVAATALTNLLGATSATAAEINRAADVSERAVLAGSSLSVTTALHDKKLILLDQAAGSTCTLPAASGSGAKFCFAVHTLATSNSHIIKVANATDVMRGFALNTDSDSSDAFAGFNTTNTSDTITLNRSTTGSVYIGEYFELTDIKTGFWSVMGWYAATGAPATPFSATV